MAKGGKVPKLPPVEPAPAAPAVTATPVAVPTTPTIDDALVARQAEDAKLRRRGRGSTILADQGASSATANLLGTRTLLGF